MRHFILHPSAFLLFALCLLSSVLCPPASALTDAWSVDVRQHAAVQRVFKQGETHDLAITLRDGLRPLALTNATARFYWYTNAVDNLWWTNSAAISSNTVSVSWTPAMDTGATMYWYWVGIWPAGSTSPLWRVTGNIRLLPSPGFTPNTLPLPVRALDFASLTVTNAPWSTPADLAAATNALWSASETSFESSVVRIVNIEMRTNLWNAAYSWGDHAAAGYLAESIWTNWLATNVSASAGLVTRLYGTGSTNYVAINSDTNLALHIVRPVVISNQVRCVFADIETMPSELIQPWGWPSNEATFVVSGAPYNTTLDNWFIYLDVDQPSQSFLRYIPDDSYWYADANVFPCVMRTVSAGCSGVVYLSQPRHPTDRVTNAYPYARSDQIPTGIVTNGWIGDTVKINNLKISKWPGGFDSRAFIDCQDYYGFAFQGSLVFYMSPIGASWPQNKMATFGGNEEAVLYFDGTDMIIDSARVGTGKTRIKRDVISEGSLTVAGTNTAAEVKTLGGIILTNLGTNTTVRMYVSNGLVWVSGVLP